MAEKLYPARQRCKNCITKLGRDGADVVMGLYCSPTCAGGTQPREPAAAADGALPAGTGSPGAGSEAIPDGFTEEDLRLGMRACKYMNTLCISALVVCAGIALFVFLNVPWNTFHPDPGKYGGYYPMQITLALPLIGILFLGPRVRRRRKPDDHHMRKGSRVGLYILGTSMVLLLVWTQWTLAGQIIEYGFTAPYRWER